MKKFTIGCAALIGVLALGGCDSLGQALGSHTDLVARAGGHELTIDEAAAFFEAGEEIRAEPEVVEAVVEFWTDYVLLATVANDESLLETLDLSPLIDPQIEQGLVMQLREEEVQVDTAVTEAELREIYETEAPNLEVRARHILLRLPENASASAQDSVLTLARELRQRAVDGEPFDALAREYSEDPGSAERGGDLGYFTRGRMVAPFDEAAFSLEPEDVSEVVETPFGYHIIKVLDRRMPSYDEASDEFEEQWKQQRVAAAEQAFVQELTEPRDITIEEDAFEVVRELTRDPGGNLSGRALRRSLVTYEDGEVTAGEFRDLVRRLPSPQRTQFSEAPDAQLRPMLQSLARNEILVAEATRRLPAIEPEQRDSMVAAVTDEIRSIADMLELIVDDTVEGEARRDAVEAAGSELLTSILRGERGLVPLGPAGYVLREALGAEMYERNYPAVLERVRDVGADADADAPSTETSPSSTTPTVPTPPDTADASS